jgi:maltose alpha-D-glucosyltransferase / alpha-amylase
MLAVVNLADEPTIIDLGPQDVQEGDPIDVFTDSDYPAPRADLHDIDIGPYGYRWIRLRRSIGARAGSSTQH